MLIKDVLVDDHAVIIRHSLPMQTTIPPSGNASSPANGKSPSADKSYLCVQGVISPLLANIYLHYVLDLWAQRWRQREATGDMIIVRYADDVIVGFEHEGDARRFLDAMRALRCRSTRTRPA